MHAERDFYLIGVIHLMALPGAPQGSLGLNAVLERAMADADTLVRGGIHHCIVENFWDSPFPADDSLPHVAACMTRVAGKIRDELGDALQLGINVLRNDSISAMAVAVAAGVEFIRVNVHVGSTWTDQGLIQSRAHKLMQYRRSLDAGGLSEGVRRVSIAADVMVKHGSPAGNASVVDVAKDAVFRGGADSLIVTGTGTGRPADMQQVHELKKSLPQVPIWVGSGVNIENIDGWKSAADAAIVGTYLHRDSDLRAPIDVQRVKALVGRL